MAMYLEDFDVGGEWLSPGRTITEADVVAFAMLSGDWDEIHTNEEYSKRESPYKTRIAYGLLALNLVDGLKRRIPVFADTRYVASLKWTCRFTNPILIGDTVHVKFRINNLRESKSKPDCGIIWEGAQMINQRGEMVLDGEHAVLIWRRPRAVPRQS